MKRSIFYFLIIVITLTIGWSRLPAQNYLKGFALPAISRTNSDAINRRFKTCLKVDPAGNVWLTFGGGILGGSQPKWYVSDYGACKLTGSSWTCFNTSNSPLPSDFITNIEFNGGDIWMSTKGGLAKLSGSDWTIYRQSNSGIISDSVNDVLVINNDIWLATDYGVSRLSGNSFVNFTTSSSGLISNRVNCIEAGTNGDIIFGTNEGISVYNSSNNSWISYTTANSGLKSNVIHTLRKDIYLNIWIGANSYTTDSGYFYSSVFVLRDGTIKPLSEFQEGCTVNYNEHPLQTISFAMHGGDVMFDSRYNQNKYSLRLLKFAKSELSEYKLIKDNSQSFNNPNDGMLMEFDHGGNLWFAGRPALYGDSLYRFIPSAYVEKQMAKTSMLEINQVKTPVLCGGDMYWDLVDGGYEVPKGSCKKAIYTGALWMGGIVNNELRLAGQTYRQSGNDYWPGPLTNITDTTDAVTAEKFNRFWNINRYQVEELKRRYADGSINNGTYQVPNVIQEWPAMGDTIQGYAKHLAPFKDADADGIYNPMKGDYPEIRGDQMIYWIFNDNAIMHTETQGKPLGVEVHGSAYAYTCDAISETHTDAALNYTTLYHFDIFNRSQNTIDSFKLGLWVDADLGNYSDDYVGCDPKEGYGYAFNGDDNDEGNMGYGMNPPAIGVAVLQGLKDPVNQTNKGMTGFQYYNNDNSLQGNPYKPTDYWNYLNQRWRDGSLMTYGNNGKGGTDTASFMYPGSDDPAGRGVWSESSVQNVPGDRRFLINLGPVTLPAGASTFFDYAIVFSRASSGGALASLSKLNTDVKKVKGWFNTQQFPTCFDVTKNGIPETQKTKQEGMYVYPNPAGYSISLKSVSAVKGSHYEIYDLTGKVCLKGSLSDQTEIVVESLQSGIYMIRVSGSDLSAVAKFVKW